MNGTCLALLLAVVMAPGAGVAQLRFTRNVDLPEAGLSFPLPVGAVPDPLPPPVIAPGRLTRADGVSEPVEMQNALEVWRWKQREGRWVDARGNRVNLVTPSLMPLPAGELWMTRDRVEQAIQSLETATRGWGEPELARWLEAFWGVAEVRGETIQHGRPFALAALGLFRTPLPGGRAGVAAAFKLAADPGRWRLALVEAAPGADADAAAKAVREELAPSVKPLARRERARASPPPAAAATDALAASRLRARESIRNLEGWWVAEGAHTIVLANSRGGRSKLVDAILADLETLRPLWEEWVPPWEPAREAAVVRVFGTEAEYLRYVGPEQAWTAGLWMPARQELVIRPVEEGSLMQRRQAVLATVYHEAFHQYLHGAFERVEAAPWFNEGYATLFASVRLVGARARVEKDPAAAALLKQMSRADRAEPGRILALDYPAFYAKDDRLRREHYALAWGLLYFLQADPGNRKAEPFRGIPARYREALRATRDSAAATAAAFAGVDRAALKQAFQEYWK